jgi:hypothetical protein
MKKTTVFWITFLGINVLALFCAFMEGWNFTRGQGVGLTCFLAITMSAGVSSMITTLID